LTSLNYSGTEFIIMFFRIAMTSSRTTECALGIAPVFAALGPVIRWPNTANRFAYSKREVLIAT
jgi:hypothetical protein